MTCQSCGFSFPVTQTVRQLTICPRCWRSVRVETGEAARAADTLILDESELKALRKLRAQARTSR